jgi:hypothetical protein
MNVWLVEYRFGKKGDNLDHIQWWKQLVIARTPWEAADKFCEDRQKAYDAEPYDCTNPAEVEEVRVSLWQKSTENVVLS